MAKVMKSKESGAAIVGIENGTRNDLRNVAKLQKGILFCILIYMLAIFGQFLIPPQLRIAVALGVLVVGVISAVLVFMLAIKLYGIVLGVLSLIPLIGLIILLVVNGKATGILNSNGVKVGLLGANAGEI